MLCCTRSLPFLCAGGLLAALLASSSAAPGPQPAPVASLAQDAKPPKDAKAPKDGKPAKDAKGAPAAAAAGDFEVDPVHSTVVFRIQHMGVSFFQGRFNTIAGHVALDAATPGNSVVEITIESGSIDTNNAKRDDDCRGPDLLNASEFPQIGFKSESVKALGKDRFEVAGQLSFHGETKPLTVQVDQTGMGQGRGGQIAGFETTFTIKRSDFGMDGMQGALGDEVRLTLAIEAHAK
jgi:polyisoprenoid-binding protein YceI